ncbi:MAG: hypothetical protein ACOZIN_17195 [Myxococcota bacterium]
MRSQNPALLSTAFWLFLGGCAPKAPPPEASEPLNGPFYGGLHSHTSYAFPSYAGVPLDAYQTARSYVLPGTTLDINTGTDWWATTDYYWSFIFRDPSNWGRTFEQASQMRQEGFPAVVGWEWSNMQAGDPTQRDHICCFPLNQTDPGLPAFDQSTFTGEVATLAKLYANIGNPKNPHLCTFAHPELQSTDEPLPAFNAFAYDAVADEAMSLVDIRGEGDGLRGYFQALNMGWHVSPTMDEDNKAWDWGMKSLAGRGVQRRVGVFASENAVEALMKGLREGRTFATADKSLSARMVAQAHGQEHFMGSVLPHTSSLTLSLFAQDEDTSETVTLPYPGLECGQTGCSPKEADAGTAQPDSPYFAAAYLYTNGGSRTAGSPEPLSGAKVVKEWSNLHTREFNEVVTLDPVADGTNVENATRSVWYVLRLVQEDGDQVVTAPIVVRLE